MKKTQGAGVGRGRGGGGREEEEAERGAEPDTRLDLTTPRS